MDEGILDVHFDIDQARKQSSESSAADVQIPEISPGAFGRELLLSQESLIALADETGGTAAVRSNDIPGALARIRRAVARLLCA